MEMGNSMVPVSRLYFFHLPARCLYAKRLWTLPLDRVVSVLLWSMWWETDFRHSHSSKIGTSEALETRTNSGGDSFKIRVPKDQPNW